MLTGLMRLEERIVLDASGAASDSDHDADRGDADSGPNPERDGDAGDVGEQAGERILIVDKALSGASRLAVAAGEGVVVVEHDSRSSTLAELRDMIAAACEGRDILSIALAGHGEQAYFRLAQDVVIDPASLSSDPMLADFLRFIAETVGEDGRVDILGCDFAAGEAGAELLAALESLTGVNFAASDDATGNAEHGGDWLLESDDVDASRDYFDAERLSDFSGLLATNTFFDYYPESLKPVEGEGLFQSKPVDLVDFADLVERSLDGAPHYFGTCSVTGKLYFDITFNGGEAGGALRDLIAGFERLSGLSSDYFGGTPYPTLDAAYYGKFVIDADTGDIFQVDTWGGYYKYVATWSPTNPDVISTHYDLDMFVVSVAEPSRYYGIFSAGAFKEGHTGGYGWIGFFALNDMMNDFLNNGLMVADNFPGGELVISTFVSTYLEDHSAPGLDFSDAARITIVGTVVDEGEEGEEEPDNTRRDTHDTTDDGGNGRFERFDGSADGQLDGRDVDGGGEPNGGDYYGDFLDGREYDWSGDFAGTLRGYVDVVLAELGTLSLELDNLLDGDVFGRLSASLEELLSGLNTLNAATAKMLLNFSEMDASIGASLSGLVGELANRGESLGAEAMKAASGLGSFARAWRLASPESRDGMAADRIAELGFRIEQLNFDLKAAILAVKAFSEKTEDGVFQAGALRAYVEERYREAQALFEEAQNAQDRMFFDIKTSRMRQAGGMPVAP